ncbi:hypothetical protein ACFU9X_23750 [Streptomyces atratus]|uniref:hypothetical protein n=1 Tax=Streptomyces atratus TaxID=1893 RepID=UPI0036A4B877
MEQIGQLRKLAAEFEDLHTRVRGLTYTLGTDALHKISVPIGAVGGVPPGDLAGAGVGCEEGDAVAVDQDG